MVALLVLPKKKVVSYEGMSLINDNEGMASTKPTNMILITITRFLHATSSFAFLSNNKYFSSSLMGFTNFVKDSCFDGILIHTKKFKYDYKIKSSSSPKSISKLF